MGSRLLSVALTMALLVPSMVHAKTKSDINFTFPKDRPVNIVVFRPDVQVGSLGTSGVESPNADWTADGRKNLAAALEQDQAGYAHKLISRSSAPFLEPFSSTNSSGQNCQPRKISSIGR
jgi:hypothetical protein